MPQNRVLRLASAALAVATRALLPLDLVSKAQERGSGRR